MKPDIKTVIFYKLVQLIAFYLLMLVFERFDEKTRGIYLLMSVPQFVLFQVMAIPLVLVLKGFKKVPFIYLILLLIFVEDIAYFILTSGKELFYNIFIHEDRAGIWYIAAMGLSVLFVIWVNFIFRQGKSRYS